ncbi:MAG: hypothetical protein V2A70_03880 [Candidatus Omnitrophota bacterium]
MAQREAGDSLRSLIEEHLSGWTSIERFAGEVIYSTPELIDVLVKHKGVIGYAPLSMAKPAGLTIFKLDGVVASPENVARHTYPLLTPFALVWKGELKGVAKDFVDYLFSPQGQKIIMDNGAVPAS